MFQTLNCSLNLHNPSFFTVVFVMIERDEYIHKGLVAFTVYTHQRAHSQENGNVRIKFVSLPICD